MKIEPRLGAGIRDYLPEDMIPRQRMFKVIEGVFERFGFVPLDTPGLELEEILTGGDAGFKMQIFRAGLRGGIEETLALRFDLTVPLARVVAQYPGRIEKPFRRYQIGKVWRGEKPQAGRFREFVQCDADIVGSASPAADAEIVALIYTTMTELGLTSFVIRINNRKLLNGLPELVGFNPEFNIEVLRTIDKLDRDGWENVASELSIQFQFDPHQLARLKEFLDMRRDNPQETLKVARQIMATSQIAIQGVEELELIRQYLGAAGIPSKNWTIDLSVARGLGYYTGPVFETILTDLPDIGSVFSGGRFDDLVARFGNITSPATGASVGIDRLFVAMEKLGLVKKTKTLTQVIVLNFDEGCSLEVARLVANLRAARLNTELYLGKDGTLKGQLAYATRNEIPVVIIMGGNEKARGMAQVKNMAAREQKEIPIAQVGEEVCRVLAL